jgi:hypothetical protein
MIDFPLGAIIIFSLFCVVGIMAFAEGMSMQRNMQQSIKEIHDSVQEVRDAVKSVAAKAGKQIANIEGRLEACQSCPTQDRMTAERRKSNDDWMIDSNFKNQK